MPIDGIEEVDRRTRDVWLGVGPDLSYLVGLDHIDQTRGMVGMNMSEHHQFQGLDSMFPKLAL
jgi:hypothetical protein